MTKNLLLSANKKSWQVSSLHGTRQDPEKKNIKTFEKVWERDKHKCFYCDFQDKKWNEIHHLNDDHEDISMDNLVTICPLCHQCFHLNLVNTTNGGTVIWLPEFTQQELNYLLRGLFVNFETKEDEIKDIKFHQMALSIYQSLEAREQVVSQHFYNGTSVESNERNVGAFGQMLLNLSEDEYNNRDKFIKNFKLLASSSRFPIQMKYWKSVSFHDLPLTSWEKLIIQ